MAVLVVVQNPVCVVARVPVLAESHGRDGGVHVGLDVGAEVAADKVEAPAIVADAVAEELEPLDVVVADPLLRVVNVWGGCIIFTLLGVSLATIGRVVWANDRGIPGESASKLVPFSIRTLKMGAAVVDNNVGNCFEPRIVHGANQIPQVLLRTYTKK